MELKYVDWYQRHGTPKEMGNTCVSRAGLFRHRCGCFERNQTRQRRKHQTNRIQLYSLSKRESTVQTKLVEQYNLILIDISERLNPASHLRLCTFNYPWQGQQWIIPLLSGINIPNHTCISLTRVLVTSEPELFTVRWQASLVPRALVKESQTDICFTVRENNTTRLWPTAYFGSRTGTKRHGSTQDPNTSI